MMVPGLSEDKKQIMPFVACFRCGTCCTEYQVNLSLAEVQRIADRLGLAWKEFLNKYIDKSWPGIKNFLLRKRNGVCVFLERVEGSKITSCLVYPFRPSSCIDWAPGLYRRECQRGLAKYWGPVVGPSGQLEGSTQKVREFYDLLNHWQPGVPQSSCALR